GPATEWHRPADVAACRGTVSRGGLPPVDPRHVGTAAGSGRALSPQRLPAGSRRGVRAGDEQGHRGTAPVLFREGAHMSSEDVRSPSQRYTIFNPQSFAKCRKSPSRAISATSWSMQVRTISVAGNRA